MNLNASGLTESLFTFHIFSAVLLILLYIALRIFYKNDHKAFKSSPAGIILPLTVLAVCEAVSVLTAETAVSISVRRCLASAVTVLFTLISARWFSYVLQKSVFPAKNKLLLRFIIYSPVAAIAGLTLFSDSLNFLIEDNSRTMGTGVVLLFLSLINGFYLLGASAIALIFMKGGDAVQKRRNLSMALFPFPVILLAVTDYFTASTFAESGFIISVFFYVFTEFLQSSRTQQQRIRELDSACQNEQKKLAVANVQAESANYAKSAFLFNMSHDVRTPLNAITGYTAMALKYINDKERVADCIGKINSSSQQLLKLMNRVLDMSRIESGDVCINEEPLEIIGLYKNSVAANQEAARFRNIELQFDTGEIVSDKVYADEVNINQIVSNIVGNAIKYSEPGSTVKCTLQQDPVEIDGIGTYSFITEDTGIGMSKEFVSHIFEVFSREKTSTLSGKAGVGLGMSVVKRIVDKMGGDVIVSSELGQGTKVTVTLHFRTIKGNMKVRTFDPDAQDLKGRRVLVVEDNEMNREIARDILEDSGLVVEEADDGTVAVEKVIEMTEQNGPYYYDFILMDIQMPNMNGYDAAKAIRSIASLQVTHLPIIAMTANAFEDDRRRSFESGMDAHLAKPIDVDELLMTLKIFLR